MLLDEDGQPQTEMSNAEKQPPPPYPNDGYANPGFTSDGKESNKL